MMDKKEDHSLGVGGLGCDGPGPWVSLWTWDECLDLDICRGQLGRD